MAVRSVSNDDIPGLQVLHKLRRDVGPEDFSDHRPVSDEWRNQPVPLKAGDDGFGLPMAERHRPSQPCPLGGTDLATHNWLARSDPIVALAQDGRSTGLLLLIMHRDVPPSVSK